MGYIMNNETNARASKLEVDGFNARFEKLPTIISEWVHERLPPQGAAIMDFGCGEGVTALGTALQDKTRRVVGVDISPDVEGCQSAANKFLDMTELPENLSLHRISPGALHDANDRFDLIYSWSVFEHIDQRLFDEVVERLRNALKPGGLMFVQIAPLYYSSEGSHLIDFVTEPWGHLLNQQSVYYEKLAASPAVRDAGQLQSLWNTYRTLNRITADELTERLCSHGLRLVKHYRTRDTIEPPAALKAIYNHETLTTNQVVLLLENSVAQTSRTLVSMNAPTPVCLRGDEPRVRVFTTAAYHELPKVRVFAAALKHHHPEFKLSWVVSDTPQWPSDIAAESIDEIIRAEDLFPHEPPPWMFGLTGEALREALKPIAMRQLLDRGDMDLVWSFDPEIVVFARLDELVMELRQGSIVLIPHQTRPETSPESVVDHEIGSLLQGVYNAGCMGVRNTAGGRAWLDWWQDRVCTFHEDGLVADQLWMNIAPALFDDLRIARGARFGVGPWNLTMRRVAGSLEDGITVDGSPLGFYHFAAVEEGAHRLMALKHAGNNPTVMALVDWYESQIRAAGWPMAATGEPAFTRANNGEVINFGKVV